jgi:hypothetical protein
MTRECRLREEEVLVVMDGFLLHLMREAIRGHHQRSSSEVIIRGHGWFPPPPDEGGNQRSSSEVIIRGHHQRSWMVSSST